MIEQKVELGSRSYCIHIGEGAFDESLKVFERVSAGGRKVFCIADNAVLKAHPHTEAVLKKAACIIPIFGGEHTKCFAKLADICSVLARSGADRKSAIVALGGGVVGDLSGFAAAVYMRGIDFYQIPTTLLAMVDSSVGGKTGINIAEGKNLVGAFHQPCGVFADTSFLSTLPQREFAAGMAEVIKCAVLGDAKMFSFLENLEAPLSPRDANLSEAIRMSCKLKAEVVAADECETSSEGGRALLNLGHTFGHAIENCAGYGNYLHGEAVAMGIIMAAMLSKKLGLINSSDLQRIENVILKNRLPVRLREPLDIGAMLAAMSHDKKSACGKLKFVLIKSIGKTFTAPADGKLVREVLEEFVNCR